MLGPGLTCTPSPDTAEQAWICHSRSRYVCRLSPSAISLAGDAVARSCLLAKMSTGTPFRLSSSISSDSSCTHTVVLGHWLKEDRCQLSWSLSCFFGFLSGCKAHQSRLLKPLLVCAVNDVNLKRQICKNKLCWKFCCLPVNSWSPLKVSAASTTAKKWLWISKLESY